MKAEEKDSTHRHGEEREKKEVRITAVATTGRGGEPQSSGAEAKDCPVISVGPEAPKL